MDAPSLFTHIKEMATKVLVNAIGQHIVAEAKQIEEKETKKIIAYLVTNPRVASYSRDDDGNVNVGFAPYCVLSNESEYTIRAEHIVSILEPREDVATQYAEMVTPKEEPEAADAAPVGLETAPVEEEAVAVEATVA